MHQHQIHRQAVQPGAEATVTTIRSDLPYEMDENILRQIFCFRRIAHYAEADCIDLPVMFYVKLAERAQVAVRNRTRQQIIRIDCLGR